MRRFHFGYKLLVNLTPLDVPYLRNIVAVGKIFARGFCYSGALRSRVGRRDAL